MQQRLQAAGFNPGPIDGKNGPRTRSALEAFQRASGARATGNVNAQTLRAAGQRPPSFANVRGGASSTAPSLARPLALKPGQAVSGGVSARLPISGGVSAKLPAKPGVLDRVELRDLARLPSQALAAVRGVADNLKGPAAARLTEAFNGRLGNTLDVFGRGLTAFEAFRDSTAQTLAGRLSNAAAAVGADAAVGGLLSKPRGGALAVIDATIGIGTTLGRATGLLSEQQATFIGSAAPGSIIGGVVNNLTTAAESLLTGNGAGLRAAHERNLSFQNGVAAAIGANLYERIADNRVFTAAADLTFGTIERGVGAVRNAGRAVVQSDLGVRVADQVFGGAERAWNAFFGGTP